MIPFGHLNLSASSRVGSWFPIPTQQQQQQQQHAKFTSILTTSPRPPTKPGRSRRCFATAESPSPYQVLGVPPSASVAEIKMAYRKLALNIHPDVNKHPNAQAQFLTIKNAYNTLLLAVVDSQHNAAASQPPTEEFYGLADLFRDLQQDWEASASKGNPKTLWEELTDIGEEFVEFLEKELNISDSDQDTNTASTPNARIQDDIDDIEATLARLKKELGL